MPAIAAMITKIIGLMSTKTVRAKTIAKSAKVNLSTIAFLKSLTIAVKIKTQTATRIPAKAF